MLGMIGGYMMLAGAGFCIIDMVVQNIRAENKSGGFHALGGLLAVPGLVCLLIAVYLKYT